MISTDVKIVELNKQRVLLLFIGSCACVAVGVWVLGLDEASIRAQQLGHPRLLYFIAILSILLFGLTAIFGLNKLLGNKPGLVFDSAGIVDNSSGLSSGLIPWSEVVSADIFQLRKQKLLVIKVKDPQKYIENGGRLRGALYSANLKTCGSPIAISTSALNIGFFELIAIFNHYRQKYGETE